MSNSSLKAPCPALKGNTAERAKKEGPRHAMMVVAVSLGLNGIEMHEFFFLNCVEECLNDSNKRRKWSFIHICETIT